MTYQINVDQALMAIARQDLPSCTWQTCRYDRRISYVMKHNVKVQPKGQWCLVKATMYCWLSYSSVRGTYAQVHRVF